MLALAAGKPTHLPFKVVGLRQEFCSGGSRQVPGRCGDPAADRGLHRISLFGFAMFSIVYSQGRVSKMKQQ
jgi:hypothetical protein